MFEPSYDKSLEDESSENSSSEKKYWEDKSQSLWISSHEKTNRASNFTRYINRNVSIYETQTRSLVHFRDPGDEATSA